jgi:hypothetical protein
MADKLTKAELKDLEAQGYVEGNINSLPDNISPVLRAKVLEAWKKDNDVTSPEELPTAVDRQNERERQRAAINGDEAMQKATGIDPDTKPDAKATGKRQGE